MEKIILDTDIGSDVDDAACLAYLLAQPRCQLLGITTVSGQPTERAKLASALCHVAGVKVPVYPGTAQPLLVAQRQPTAHQAVLLDRFAHDQDYPQGEAIDFLRRTIRAHPGEITLLAIGPLTNIALLFAVDPALPSLLRRLVLMNGWLAANRPPQASLAEWNALCDPHAAAMVYRAPVPVHRSIPFDVTQQVVMPADQVRARFRAPLLQVVRDLAQITDPERIIFHDPLAAATIFDDRLCVFHPGTIDIDLGGEATLGMTRWTPGGARHHVALEVAPDRFFEHYLAVFDQ